MAQDPLRARDNGRIQMPRVDNAMNKVAPPFNIDSKGTALGYPVGKDDTKEKILARARKNMEKAISASSDNRKSALDDRLFRVGQQWPTEVMAQRNLDKRPCLTINKLPTFIYQVVNNQRQNRPSVNVSPVGDRSDPGVAKMYRGMVRHIERKSHADLAYDTAYDDAVTSGWGWFRIITDYEGPKTFNQTLKIVRVRNPFTVYEDPTHQDPTARDMKWCFITDMLTRDEFRESYPNAVPMPYSDSGIGEKVNSWITKDEIRIAEYFELQYETRELVELSNGHVGWRDELDDLARRRLRMGILQLIDERESRVQKVMWRKITAVDVLEESEWIGTSIPLIKVTGNEVDIEGRAKLSGIIRDAKDPQRMYNYWSTAETELIALQPKAPWVMEEGQAEGHEDDWKNSNVKNIPVLYYKGTNIGGTPAPPPQRQPMSGVPAGILTAKQGAAQDMMATTGVRFDASANERMIDESGKAIHELRRTGDIGAFHYLDNLKRSIERAGEIMVECIPRVYDTRRVVTILREDDTEEQVTLDPNLPQPTGRENRPWDGKVRQMFNPTFGEYGVTVTVGPSYATKRIEASENMMAFMKALPQTAALVVDLFAKNQDWPGAEEIAARLAKTIPPNLLSGDIKDVPPQVAALLQSQEQSIKQLTEQLRAAMAGLQDKNADRAIEMEKIQRDFEAKLLKVIADVETKMAKTNESAVANFNTHIGAQIAELGKGFAEVVKTLEKAPSNDEGGQGETPEHGTPDEPLPADAMRHLRPGRVARFKNGQGWTVDESGKPRRVA